MTQWITEIVSSLGYGGIAFLMFFENLFPPIPSELIMPLAGFAAAQGKLDFTLIVIAGVIGTVIGNLAWYYLGRLIDEAYLVDWLDRYGSWIGIRGQDVSKVNNWFERHGTKAVLLGRLIPGIRTLISLPAGINKMHLMPFIIYSTIGTTVWILILTSLGYFLGERYELVDRYLAPVSKIVLLILLAWFLLNWIRRRFFTTSN